MLNAESPKLKGERYSIHIVQHSRVFGESAGGCPGRNALDDAEGYVGIVWGASTGN